MVLRMISWRPTARSRAGCAPQRHRCRPDTRPTNSDPIALPAGQNGAVTQLAQTPPPPYYAVVFTSRRNEQPGDGYAETAERMFELAAAQPGFLGYDTAHS